MGLDRNQSFLHQLRNSKNNKYKFLVIRNGLIGDAVFITPVILKLKREYENSEIDIVVGYNSKAVFHNFPGVNNIFSLPKEFSVTKQALFFLSLRKHKYDCALVQEVNTHYSIMAKLSGSRIKVGYNNELGRLHDISIERKGHVVTAEQLLVNYITGCTDIEQTSLYTSAAEDDEAKTILKEYGVTKNKIICIQFACSEKNSVRQLPVETAAQLADTLNSKPDFQVIFTGTKYETGEIEQIGNLMKTRLISLAGKTTLRNLIAVLKQVSLVIGPDTGTLHIANAVGTPVIMYTGYADPNDTGPFDKTNQSKVIQGNLDCIPCAFTNPKPANWEYCSQNRPALCMDMIKPDDIINIVNSIL